MSIFIFISCVLVLIVLTKPRWTSNYVRHEAEIAKRKVEFIEASRKLEEKLLDSTLKNGNIVHDVMFKLINHAKYRERYVSMWTIVRFLRKPDPKVQKMWMAVEEELKNGSPEIRAIEQEIWGKYFELCIARHWFWVLTLAFVSSLKHRKPTIHQNNELIEKCAIAEVMATA